MKYERITRKDGVIWEEDYTLVDLHNRLFDLENAIEAGTLVELPCKVGDTVYIITKQGLDIYAVEKVIVCDLWYSETDNCLYSMTADECPLSEIFITKAEAEAKLKELRGE